MSPTCSLTPTRLRWPEVDEPVFFVGMPRSGTTILFEGFAAHPDLGWFSQYFNRLSRFPSVALLSRIVDIDPRLRRRVERSDQSRSLLNYLRVGPSEAYFAWRRYSGSKFLDDFLIDTRASPAERERLHAAISRILRYQGKPRFAAKVTGPPRIGYLTSVFGDARFIHVIRDVRAVVQSLMRVPFWKETERLVQPAWRNGLTPDELELWARFGRSPVALAALEWRAVIRTARREASQLAPERYREVRYEDFVSDPHAVLDRLISFCNLRQCAAPHEYLDLRFELQNMNRQWRDHFGAADIEVFEEVTSDLLVELGYEEEGTRTSSS
jgi:omega-hydroxy-beta-dihydromenaquinone-9 sulfotransferase